MISVKFFLSVFFLLSCAQLESRRGVYDSKLSIRGGKFQSQKWNESLDFKKYTWLKDASLSNEVLFSTISKDSKFNLWFEKSTLNQKCEKKVIFLLYSEIGNKFKNSYITAQLDKKNLDPLDMTSFSDHIQSHYIYADLKLSKHQVVGYCKKTNVNIEFSVSIPGFEVVNLK